MVRAANRVGRFRLGVELKKGLFLVFAARATRARMCAPPEDYKCDAAL